MLRTLIDNIRQRLRERRDRRAERDRGTENLIARLEKHMAPPAPATASESEVGAHGDDQAEAAAIGARLAEMGITAYYAPPLGTPTPGRPWFVARPTVRDGREVVQ